MGHRTAAEGHRVLITAPFGRDAESVGGLLKQQGYDAHICRDMTAIGAALDEHVGAVLVTEEALTGDLAPFFAAIDGQPPWSDVPFILLASRRSGRPPGRDLVRDRLSDRVTNTIVLERPLGAASLESAVASAMRSRQKQFNMRDRLIELDDARRDLLERETQLRLATDAAEVGFWDVDLVRKTLFWPPLLKAMFGISADVPVSLADFYAGLHPDDREATGHAFEAALDPEERALYDVEYRTVGREDGIIRWVAAKGRGIFEEARCVRVLGTAIDITARKANELELVSLNATLEKRVRERTDKLMQAEAALRQSQKMEAVGQLTGGIAHDFNNMLTGVIGALDIIKRRLATGRIEDLDRLMDAAASSAQRAAALTARLLAFSRRQSLDARAVDVNALALSLEDLIRRTVRENISLLVIAGENVPTACVDENQLENAILNLAINARDAMPDGGQLTVETSAVDLDEAYAAATPDVHPGRYVTVAVSDTGVGMSPDVLDKVFEPFFTTKPIGQGTGLGLSMVYGFARQSGGQVRIHSELGQGTSVKMFLPVATQEPSDADTDVETAREGNGQTVLLVEDDEAVRLLVREVLEELSYQTIEAGNADVAIPILRSERPIDLLISDVGLPGMNGRQLAEVAREHRPDLPILFVTGYAENAAIRAGFLGTNMGMITKPFAIQQLSAKIAEMMTSVIAEPSPRS